MRDLPSHARVVIIGGGIVGCSVAYHLAKRGCKDVLLLERRQLTCGTTWHAAGLVGQLRATRNLTRLAQYTTQLYEGLERETGQATGFRQVGSIAVAASAARFEELKRGASMARSFGLEVQILSPGAARERWPLLSTAGLVGAVFLPKDGRTNPVDTTQALARGARSAGVRIVENLKVTGIRSARGRVSGVATEAGEVRADAVVNCAGMWAREVGAWAGVSVPLHAAEHFYIVTQPIAGLAPDLPVLRDADARSYFKEDTGKLLVGWFEPEAKPWGWQGIPENFAFEHLPADLGHIEPLFAAAMRRVLRRGGGLRARQLVCDRRRRAALRLQLRPPELVRAFRRRAPGRPRARGPLRSVLVRQICPVGPRRGRRARTDLRQRGRRARGEDRLYAVAD